MERKNKSPVWKVFIKDAAHKQTVCTLCGKEFKYRYTTTNLRDHLKRYHPDWLPECGMVDSKEPKIVSQYPSTDVVAPRSIYVEVNETSCLDNSGNDDEPARKNKSAVWQVFVKDAENKNVTCTLCEKDFKFWNNTTNLRAHLRRSHPDWCPETPQSFTESGDEMDSDYEVATIEGGRRSSTSSSGSFVAANVDNLPKEDSFVWRVFVKDESNKKVFCTLCQKHFSTLNSAFNMVDHLRRLHPGWEPPVSELSPKGSDQEDENISDTKPVMSGVPANSVFLIHSERKNRSPVWEVFVKDTAKKRTICMLCSKEFKCWNNTANLLDHLRRIHPNWKPGSGIKPEDGDNKRPTIARISNTFTLGNISKPSLPYLQSSLSTTLPSAALKTKQIDKLIGQMICLDFQNLNIVEDCGFKKLMKELVPHYTTPSRNTIVRQTLPEIYDSVCKHIRQDLAKIKYVAISTELWTNMYMEAFVTLTVHYFSDEKYTSSILQTERIQNDHSSEDLASVMHRIFDHWKITDKTTAIVADDDEAIKAACSMLNIMHLPCVAHMVNGIMTEVLTQNDDAQVLLQRCQNLVAHFKMNPSATDVLHDIQSQMGHAVLNLKQVEPTRWNSALHMFQRLVEMKEPLSTTLVALPQGPEPLASCDWLNLEDFIAVLKPFELLTSELSADSYCNISKVVPLIRGVQSSLQNVTCASDLGAALKKSLLEKLDDRFSNYEKYLIPTVATLLDPRFKRAGVGVEATIESSHSFVVEQLSELKSNMNETGSVKLKNSESGKVVDTSSDIWNFLDEKVHELSSQKAPANSAEMSVSQYLDLPYLKRHDCPFKFWISQSTLEPELADIAMKFMCIPATSFPADRLYSKSGINISERRSRITTKNFDTIIFLNKNLSYS